MEDNMENLQTHVKVYEESTMHSCSQLSMTYSYFHLSLFKIT